MVNLVILYFLNNILGHKIKASQPLGIYLRETVEQVCLLVDVCTRLLTAQFLYNRQIWKVI